MRPRLGIILLWFAALVSLRAQTVRDQHVEAELVASRTAVEPGGSVWLALRLTHDPDWHTYWKSSTTGYAPSLEWTLPPGFSAGEIHWPVPKVHTFGPITDFVYEGTILLPVEVQVPPDAAVGETVTLRAHANWLMCAEVCIPGKADLAIDLQVVAGGTEVAETSWAEGIDGTLDTLPAEDPAWHASALRRGDDLVLEIRPDSGQAASRDAGPLYFFKDQMLVAAEETQEQKVLPDGGMRLFLKVDKAAPSDAQRLSGVLADGGTWGGGDARGLAIDVPLVSGEAVEALTGGEPPPETGEAAAPPASISLWGILGAAFLGGLILNLMPCVFPVLGIKIMSFVKQAGQERSRVIAQGLAYGGGILLTFWALVCFLLLANTLGGGNVAGWGAWQQYPQVVFIEAVVLLLFGLNMSGVFEIGAGAMGVGSGLQARPGLQGAFFSGVLAVVVATPCSAPFLATAIGFAAAQAALTQFFIFTFVALGLATPYLLMSVFPGLVRILPRPGPWMESLKQGLAFLLYASVAYLVWDLGGRMLGGSGAYGEHAFLFLLLGLVLAAMAAWAYGRWAQASRSRSPGIVVTLGLGVLALWIGMPSRTPIESRETLALAQPGDSARPALLPGETHPTFVPWRPGLPEQLAAEGKTVWVDFTARWCATCQTNKWIIFNSGEVLDYFRDNEVVALKADWTDADPAITAELARWGRAAVPFNLIYEPEREPVALPAALTPGIVLEAFGDR